jgi:hypothetical protein
MVNRSRKKKAIGQEAIFFFFTFWNRPLDSSPISMAGQPRSFFSRSIEIQNPIKIDFKFQREIFLYLKNRKGFTLGPEIKNLRFFFRE